MVLSLFPSDSKFDFALLYFYYYRVPEDGGGRGTFPEVQQIWHEQLLDKTAYFVHILSKIQFDGIGF